MDAPTFEDGRDAYERGDFLIAFEIWKPLAESGDIRAQKWVGYLYSRAIVGDGQRFEPDLVQAYRWLNRAAKNGDPLAESARDGLTRHMTPEQLAEAQQLADDDAG